MSVSHTATGHEEDKFLTVIMDEQVSPEDTAQRRHLYTPCWTACSSPTGSRLLTAWNYTQFYLYCLCQSTRQANAGTFAEQTKAEEMKGYNRALL